ncbi:hypothetical protein P7K49_004693 [Saguinus oedipus]|uniref:Uncharacterized protein n=1 Tax=Saguinus oedipus TaxID=9490 RepID=A0ABQ9W856_SAGOE|nr:hypothetical protein P7K49_004693 [Saguinus oedipus]
MGEATHWRNSAKGTFGSRESAPEAQWEPPGDPEDRICWAARYLPTPPGHRSENQGQGHRSEGLPPGQEDVLWISPVRRAQSSDPESTPATQEEPQAQAAVAAAASSEEPGHWAPQLPHSPGSSRFEDQPKESEASDDGDLSERRRPATAPWRPPRSLLRFPPAANEAEPPRRPPPAWDGRPGHPEARRFPTRRFGS